MASMTIVPMVSTLSMKALSIDGDSDKSYEGSRDFATRSDVLNLQKELEEARSEFKLQTNLMKNVVEQIDHLESEYRNRRDDWPSVITYPATASYVDELPVDAGGMPAQRFDSYLDAAKFEAAGDQDSRLDKVELAKEQDKTEKYERTNEGFLKPHTKRKSQQYYSDEPADERFDRPLSSGENRDLEDVAVDKEVRSLKNHSRLVDKKAMKQPGNGTNETEKSGFERWLNKTMTSYEEWMDKYETEVNVGSNGSRIGLQLLFGVIYFLLIVRYYPQLPLNQRPPQEAVDIQKMNPIAAMFNARPKIVFCSFCCPGPRAAHTYDSTGVMDYWFGLCCMSFFPCCTLWVTNSATDLNPRLGGDQMSVVGGCLASMCCSCCLIAQDAQALDYATGMETHCCSFEPKRPLQPLQPPQELQGRW